MRCGGVLLFVLLILIGSAAEAHFRPASPFVLRRSRPWTAARDIATAFPRGGAAFSTTATTTKPAADKAVPSSAVSSPLVRSDKKGVVSSNVSAPRGGGGRGGRESKFSISRANLGWVMSFVLSVVYLVLLLTQASPPCDFAEDGFCITNLIKSSDGTYSCPRYDNSHWWSWQVDAVYTALVVILGIKTSAEKSTIGGLVAAVLFHGLLHRSFAVKSCALNTSPGQNILGNILYGAFIALISYLSLAMAGLSKLVVVLFTVVGTAATVWLSQPKRPYGVSPIFMYTQLLVSFVSLVSTTTPPNQLMGDLFVLPCLVSIIELLFCCTGDGAASLFNKYGGHVWYDFFLHGSLLATYFPNAK